jgi:hypothetical protein
VALQAANASLRADLLGQQSAVATLQSALAESGARNSESELMLAARQDELGLKARECADAIGRAADAEAHIG